MSVLLLESGGTDNLLIETNENLLIEETRPKVRRSPSGTLGMNLGIVSR